MFFVLIITKANFWSEMLVYFYRWIDTLRLTLNLFSIRHNEYSFLMSIAFSAVSVVLFILGANRKNKLL